MIKLAGLHWFSIYNLWKLLEPHRHAQFEILTQFCGSFLNFSRWFNLEIIGSTIQLWEYSLSKHEKLAWMYNFWKIVKYLADMNRIQRLMEDFSVKGIHQMFGSPIFRGRNETLLLDRALKLGNFSKICIKMKKFESLLRKYDKMQIF